MKNYFLTSAEERGLEPPPRITENGFRNRCSTIMLTPPVGSSTGFEPAIFWTTIRRFNQLSYELHIKNQRMWARVFSFTIASTSSAIPRDFFLISRGSRGRTYKWIVTIRSNSHLATDFMEERVGFEPTGPGGPLVFKTSSINRSDTSPRKPICQRTYYNKKPETFWRSRVFHWGLNLFSDYYSLTLYTGPVPLGLDRLGVCRDNCDVCLRVFIAYDFIYPFLFLIYIPKIGKVSVIKKFFRKKIIGKILSCIF